MNSRRRIRDLPRWIEGAYPGRGCIETGHVEAHIVACRWFGDRIKRSFAALHESVRGPPSACNAPYLQPTKADSQASSRQSQPDTSTSGTTYATTCGMYYRHVVGHRKFINQFTALSKWHLPPCTPTYSWIQLISRRAGWVFAAWGSWCPPEFAPHYVAVSMVDVVASQGHRLLALSMHLAHWRTKSEDAKVRRS